MFGNAVCAKIGNVTYLLLYIGLGLVAAFSHLAFDGRPLIGASGAINGVVGMFLVLFPENEITCYWVLFSLLPIVREFTVSSLWMILLWFAFDLLGALLCSQSVGVAYFAHVGGFMGGVAAAIVLLKTGVVVMEPRYEKSLLQWFSEWRHPVKAEEPMSGYWEYQKAQAEAAEAEEAAPGIRPAEAVVDRPDEERRIRVDDPPTEDFIRFACPCGKKVKNSGKYAGGMGKCPQCHRRLQIPRN